MFIVKVKDSGTTVAICSRLKDALAYLHSQHIDKTTYIIEEVK